ncbi:hypothetical protein FZEAL_2010 [Fusarium zealandicum]|uniref:Ankyrin n=1 Tax=Fusarium zealandicum TaxID=1053134 RepID=A0A8H4USC4_9HYPO|nr:hypothetical protein FZEAL_2010 [Fusarium zealandicum]
MIPTQADISAFKDAMEWLGGNLDDSEYGTHITATLAVLKYLLSSPVLNTSWGIQIEEIVWHHALAMNLLSAENEDPWVFSSEESLLVKMRRAIWEEDVDSIQQCLADGRLDKLDPDSESGDTWLHMAVRMSSFRAIETLLDAGHNPYVLNLHGDLPIHMNPQRMGVRRLEIFKERRFCLTSPNAKGYTVWHLWFASDPYISVYFNDVFELYPEVASEALQTKSLEGDTPLSLLLESKSENRQDMRRDDQDAGAITMIKKCSKIPDFWQNHDPVFSAAAEFGSEDVIRLLIQVGARTEPVSEGSCTPLHRIHPRMSLEGVELLLAVFPGAVEYRFEGCLPVEAYIERTLRQVFDPKSGVIEALITPHLLNNQDEEQKTLWGFVCSLSNKVEEWIHEDEHAGRSSRFSYPPHNQWDVMNIIVVTILRLGAMEAYEKLARDSGILPLFSIHDLHPRLSVDTVRDLLERTSFWTTAKGSTEVVDFFRFTIYHKHDMARTLLEYNFDVHQRSHDLSSIEHACVSRRAVRLCASEEGKAIFNTLLDHCTLEGLIQTPTRSKDYKGMSLLHMLATSKDASSILWLAEALVHRGVNINAVTENSRGVSVLAHHLYKSSVQFADLLLKLGADPLGGGFPHSATAIQAAIETENVGFLKRLLAHTTKKSTAVEWKRSMHLKSENDGYILDLEQANALHCAAMNNSADCLEFLLDEGLIPIENSRSATGWTPLHAAAFACSVATAKLLISKGFDITAKNNVGQTPLHEAASKLSFPMIKLLIENGASLESFDDMGRTPRELARKKGQADIVSYFDVLADRPKNPQFDKVDGPSRRQLNLWAKALVRAVMKSNRSECSQLMALGCPIDIPLPWSGVGSALLLALRTKNTEMVEWLLENGASALKSALTDESRRSAIEIAVSEPSLNPLLPKLVSAHCYQGGDLIGGEDRPIDFAVWSGNIRGLELLLDTLDGCIDTYASKYQMNPRQAWAAILNRRWPYGPYTPEPTALHVAAIHDHRDAVSLLVEKGAAIDEPDTEGLTPLLYAESVDMAELFLDLGATTGAICKYGSFQSLMRWFVGIEFDEVLPVIVSKLPRDLVLALATVRPLTPCVDLKVTARSIRGLKALGCDLTSEDGSGRSLMHCIICKHKGTAMINQYRQELLETTPFPWHLEWGFIKEKAFLGSRFQHFRKILSYDTFRTILNLEPSCGWSPLCLAAASDLTQILANCLEMGANIDFYGSPVGSAVMMASFCGSLEAVKFLVRNGASISYVGESGSRSCFSLAGSEAVRSWLLSGRFMDQLAIAPLGADGELQDTAQVSFWSGIVRARVKVYGRDERSYFESALDYAKRLASIRKRWRGRIVPLMMDGDTLVFPEDVICNEEIS